MIGAGTLSRRLGSTPPSFNELCWAGEQLAVCVRNLEGHDTPEMMTSTIRVQSAEQKSGQPGDPSSRPHPAVSSPRRAFARLVISFDPVDAVTSAPAAA
jgi:hypothetical protein